MGNKLKNTLKASDLAIALDLPSNGSNDIEINMITSFDDAIAGCFCFSKAFYERSTVKSDCTIIGPPDSVYAKSYILFSNKPRLDFAKALNWIDKHVGFKIESSSDIHPTANISSTAIIGKGVKIGKYTTIGHFVVIGDEVEIGDYCVIKSGAIIGEKGFGFERDENGIPVPLIHIGIVRIGNHVEIGALNTVCRATLGVTSIDDFVKTDDHVHIAHNCRVRRGALIAACVEISGGVDVGENVWIGPNSSIIQKVEIGNNAFVGIAANVTKKVDENTTVAGNPAKVLR